MDMSLRQVGAIDLAALLADADALANLAAGGFNVVTRNYMYNGATWDRWRNPIVFKSLSAVVITSETTIWTPTAGKKFRFMGGLITQGVATGAVTLKDNTAGSTILILPPHTIAQAVAFSLGGNGILSAAANNVLTATGASTETLTGFIYGTEE
jgi:hypothetical protein